MALPLLDAMVPTRAFAGTAGLAGAAAKGTPPVRMAFMMVPNGINMAHWTPTAEGTGYVLPDTMASLADVRSDFDILTGLTQQHAFANGDGPGDHARSCACWLTGVQPKKTSGADIHNGISVDQVAAMHIGNLTKFPSLEIGCERGGQNGDCDSGYSCAYSSSISWRGEATPMAKEVNPRLVFERLFGTGSAAESKEARSRRELFQKSVLDFVMEDAANLKGQLGRHDQNKLDEYFTAIREIEERLVRFESGGSAGLANLQAPGGIPSSYGEHIRLMGDMMILAFQTDLTRICTFMFANEGSNRSYHEIGVEEGHHDISHHGGNPDKLRKKKMIDTFHVDQVAYMLKKMKTIKEGDSTLLDNTMVMYGGGISDGNAHNHDDLPILLAGRAAGLKGGSHIVYKDYTPLNNLYISLLDRIGVQADKLGDSTGRLEGLF
jgi:hypothetical protein